MTTGIDCKKLTDDLWRRIEARHPDRTIAETSDERARIASLLGPGLQANALVPLRPPTMPLAYKHIYIYAPRLGGPRTLFSTAEEAVGDFWGQFTEGVPEGAKLYWRAGPEIEFLRDFETNEEGYHIYARVSIFTPLSEGA